MIESVLNVVGTVSPFLFLVLLAIGLNLSIYSARIFNSNVDPLRAEGFTYFELLRNYLANGDPETVNRKIPL
jgi:hypothetical protein